jgi:hypothetical protein
MKLSFRLLLNLVPIILMLTSCVAGIDGPSMPPIPEGEDNSPLDNETEQEIDLSENQAEIRNLEDANQGTSIRVLWRITDYVLADSFQGDESKAKDRLFLTLDINENEIYFDGQVCIGVKFLEETADTVDFLSSSWDISPERLGISEFQQIQVFKTNCSLFGFDEYIRISDGRLIVREDDAFFIFEPVFN